MAKEDTMKVHYSSDGEYPFTGDLDELMGNFRESGMDESIINEIVRRVEEHGEYEGTHEFGHFTITTKV